VKENSKRRILIVSIIAIVVVITVIAAIVVNGSGSKNNLRDQLDLAEQYLSDLDYEQAIAAYEQALEIDPKCEEAYLGLADIYVTLEEYDNALEILNEGYEQTGADSIVEKIQEIQAIQTSLIEQEETKQQADTEKKFTKKSSWGKQSSETEANDVTEAESNNVESETPVVEAEQTSSTYAIAFSGNGADGGSVQTINNCEFGKSYSLPDNGFSKSGYSFVAWNTKEDGSGTSYSVGESVTDLGVSNGDYVTLYAIWSESAEMILTAGNYRITEDANGYSLKAKTACIVSYDYGNNLEYKVTIDAGKSFDLSPGKNFDITIESGEMYIYGGDSDNSGNNYYVTDLGHEAVYGFVLTAGQTLVLDNQYYNGKINSNSVYVHGSAESAAGTRKVTGYWWNTYMGDDISENTYSLQESGIWWETIDSCKKVEYSVTSGIIKIFMHYDDKDKLTTT
jgi:hypothetical protein